MDGDAVCAGEESPGLAASTAKGVFEEYYTDDTSADMIRVGKKFKSLRS